MVEAVRITTDFQFNRDVGNVDLEQDEIQVNEQDKLSPLMSRPLTQDNKKVVLFGQRTLN